MFNVEVVINHTTFWEPLCNSEFFLLNENSSCVLIDHVSQPDKMNLNPFSMLTCTLWEIYKRVHVNIM